MKNQDRGSVLRLRPHVADVQFHLFGRAVHPELYEACETKEFERGKYKARVAITRAGHVVHWTFDERWTLCELVTHASSPLPLAKQLVKRRFQGPREQSLDWRKGIRYRVSLQAEAVSAELLYLYQRELSQGDRVGMLHVFGSSGRVALGGMSYMHVQARSRSLIVQTIHTFPDDAMLLKVESTFLAP